MIPELKFESKVVSFSEINLNPVGAPPNPAVTYCCLPTHPESRSGILTRDSALLLLQLQPLILWTSKHYCVLGRRTLHLVAPHLFGKDQIRVGYLPSATEKEVNLLIELEPLLNQIALATQNGSQGLFAASRAMDPEVVKIAAPLLTTSIESISKLFSDCSASTLYKLSAKLDAGNKT